MPRPTPTKAPAPRAQAPGVLAHRPPRRREGSRARAPFLRRSWAWIAVPTLAAALGAGVFVELVPPRYTGEAEILLESRRGGAERIDQAAPRQASQSEAQAMAGQAQAAMSHELAREAVRQLDLAGNPEFDADPGRISPFGNLFGNLFSKAASDYLDETVRRGLALVGLNRPEAATQPVEERMVEAYLDHLAVRPAGRARVLTVAFTARDPALAAQGANTAAGLYVAAVEAARTEAAGRSAPISPGPAIDGMRARLGETEARIEALRAKDGLRDGTKGAGRPLGPQQLDALTNQLVDARGRQAELRARAQLLQELIKDGRLFEIPDVANNELIRRTVESRMALRAQLALESRTLLPAHPRIKELTAQLNDLEAQIKSAAERIVRTLDNDARLAGARVDSLQATIDGQRDTLTRAGSNEGQLRTLEREARGQREQLDAEIARSRGSGAREAGGTGPVEARLVARAAVPETPSFPKKLPVVAGAAALAFLLSSLLVLVRRRRAAPARRAELEAASNMAANAATDQAARTVPDPERLVYPEPLPPEPSRVQAEAVAGAARARTLQPETDTRRDDAARVSPEPIMQASQAERPVPATPYDLDLLINRLEAGPRHGGRCVLVVETAQTPGNQTGTGPARALAGDLADTLARRASTLRVDVNGPAGRPGEKGLSDLVAGAAAFPDVIQPVPGSRLHAVRRGFIGLDVLAEEPQGLAISLSAMAQAYEWVVCRIDASRGETAHALLTAVAASMDSVVIASDAEADEPGLVTLYGLAEEAGAGQVLVARDRSAARKGGEPPLFRLSA